MKIYVVGGAVRDVLMGRKPQDVDYVVVGARPEEMIKQGYTKVGADFPVFLNKQGEQFALARTERKVSGGYLGFKTDYNPSVTLEEDLLRRDLTINAMAVRELDWLMFQESRDPQFVIDPYDGKADLGCTTLRHVSPAFAEDPLRVLRVARFSGRYSFSIAAQTRLLMKQITSQGEMKHLSVERVWTELVKGLMTERPDMFVKALLDVNALRDIAPELAESCRINQTNLLIQLHELALLQMNELCRVTCLFMRLHLEEAITLLDKLKAPTEFKDFVCKSIEVQAFTICKTHTARKTYNLLKRLGVYTSTCDLAEIARLFRLLYSREDFHDRILNLLSNAALTSKVTFGSLPFMVQQNLQGKEIREELDKRRLQVIELNSNLDT